MFAESANQLEAVDFLMFTLFAAALAANAKLYDHQLKASGFRISSTPRNSQPTQAAANTNVQSQTKPMCSEGTACMWAVVMWIGAFFLIRFAWGLDALTPLSVLSNTGVDDRAIFWPSICGAFAFANAAISPWPVYAACTGRRRIAAKDLVAMIVAMSFGAFVCYQFIGHALPYLMQPE